jgi:hypothetical protein
MPGRACERGSAAEPAALTAGQDRALSCDVVLGSEKRIPQRLIVLEPPTTAADQTLKQFTAGTNQ